jgi:serine/threonine protein kinase
MTQRTQPSAERSPKIGDAIGHYRIVGVVGDGGLGRFYVAEQRGIASVSQVVTLLCIRPELAHNPQFRALFFDLGTIAARFEHPNVVTIHEMGEVDGNYFIGMEYLPAENVGAILAKFNTGTHMPPDIAAAVVKQAASAVQYLHDLRAATALPVGLGPGEVHPSNIFVTYHGVVKVLGVGFGAIRNANGAAVSGAHRVDSWSQALEAPQSIEAGADPRTDVLSLGVLLWTCLTGQRPQPIRGTGEVGRSSPAQRRAAPSSLRADIPEALDAIALQALSPDPRERFQSAQALSEALERYLMKQDSRPTTKHIRRWLEHSFDPERASLQMQVAQGRDVARALVLLSGAQRTGATSAAPQPPSSMRPRELWSTSQALFSRLTRDSTVPARPSDPGPGSLPIEASAVSAHLQHAMPSSAPGTLSSRTLGSSPTLGLRSAAGDGARSPRTWLAAATTAVITILAIGTAVLFFSANGSAPLRSTSQKQPADRSGRVEVRSTPEGAAVFVDGEPSGLRTPVTLKGLAAGRKLKLRVEKPGFSGQERSIEVRSGPVETHSFDLIASVGLVRFVGVPPNASIYVDDALLALDEEPARLSIGPHSVRVEAIGSLIFATTVFVVAGEQTIRVDPMGAAP